MTKIVYFCLSQNVFPCCSSSQKEKYLLEKGNYRPVSILPTLSKIFEGVIHYQLSDFFNYHFYDMLSAFRPGYDCRSVLLKIVEGGKLALDHKNIMQPL